MPKYTKYLWYLTRHKWYVFIECCKFGLYWRGLTHDLSKFLPSEFFAYAKNFYGNFYKHGGGGTGYFKRRDIIDKNFEFAWILHQKRNKHHWQWWVLSKPQYNGFTILEMPDEYRKEMVADWRGASHAQGFGGNAKNWYIKNKKRMLLHPKTRMWIEEQLEVKKEE